MARQAAAAQTIGSTTLTNPGAPHLDPATGIMVNPVQSSGAAYIGGFLANANQVIAMFTPIHLAEAFAGIMTSSMLGEKGTQAFSTTVCGGGKNQPRIDVENPNPGGRAGQIHYQHGKNKYLYDPDSRSFSGAPKSVNSLLDKSDVKNAIDKGMRILGEQTDQPKGGGTE